MVKLLASVNINEHFYREQVGASRCIALYTQFARVKFCYKTLVFSLMQSKETEFESFVFTKVQKQRAKFIFNYILKFLVFLHQITGNLNGPLPL